MQAGGQEPHSFSLDPQFADPAAGDFHLKSTGGRWQAATATWTTDGLDSPCLDTGAPTEAFGAEPAPNGGRVNLGAYGNTAEASKSPATRTLTLLAPRAGVVRGQACVTWQAAGPGWDATGTEVTIELSRNSGGSWETLATGVGAATGGGQWLWETTSVPNATTYRLRLSSGSLTSTGTGDFSVANSATRKDYYVNDSFTAGDSYCTATGSDTSDGLTPATPKATLQAIFDAYDLEPGDTVWLDAGTYNLTANPTPGSDDVGSTAGQVRIVGVPGRSIIDRGAPTTTNTYCLVLRNYMTVQGLDLRNAYDGLVADPVNGDQILDNAISGCGRRALVINASHNTLVARNRVTHSGSQPAIWLAGNGVASDATTVTIANNTVVATGADAITVQTGTGPILSGNIVLAGGAGKACLAAVGALTKQPLSVCDYNNLYPSGGALVATAPGGTAASLAAWRQLAGYDLHSLSCDPLFADPAGRDYHLRSVGGRYDPARGLPPSAPGAWVTDVVTSLAIDAGDPTVSAGLEPPPNGGRINLGFDGGTAEASRTSAASRSLALLSPGGGEIWQGSQRVEWRADGSGWGPGDTLCFECSGDGGTTWAALPDAGTVPYAQGKLWWDTRSVPNSYTYLVRATCVQDSGARAVSAGFLAVANSGNGTGCLHVAGTGVDDRLHGTAAAPLRTVTYALKMAQGTTGRPKIIPGRGLLRLGADAPLEIRVARGTYVGSVALVPYVSLLGGYRETDWSREIEANETILDGNAAASVVTGANNSMIEGFTITNGRAANGGGVYCSSTSPLIRLNRILRNVATSNGGGVYLSSCSAALVGNLLARNTASYGSAVYCYNSPVSITNCTLDGTSAMSGALLYSSSTTGLQVTNSIVSASTSGTAIYVSGGATPAVRYCDVTGQTPYSGMSSQTGLNGNLSVDPLYVAVAADDYHEQSKGGHWDAGTGTWVTDAVSSWCLDAGNPASDYSQEPAPNGGRINMGAYGNTPHASRWGNRAPTAPTSVALTPATPKTDDDLTAAGSGSSDADGDALTYPCEWAKSTDGGTTWGAWGNAGVTLAKTLTTKGEKWKARGRADDGTDTSSWLESNVVTVADTAPVSPGKPVITPPTPGTDDDLTATWAAATDADSDTVVYAYQWLRNGSVVAGQSGTTSSLTVTLPKAQTARGQQWSLTVKAQSGSPLLYSATMASDQVTVANTAPGAPASATVSPASPKTDDNLTAACGTATDADGDALAYSYEWAKSTDGGANWGAWGNTGATLSKTLTTKGEQWKARARAHDGTECGGWTESTVVTIGDTAPTAPGKPAITPASPKTEDDLTATWTAATDADGDALTYAYQWLRDGSAVAGQSGTTSSLSVTLPKAQTTKGEKWSLKRYGSVGHAHAQFGDDDE